MHVGLLKKEYSYFTTTGIHEKSPRKIRRFDKKNGLEILFYLHRDSLDNTQIDEHYGLKSRRTPPHIPELRDLENDLDSLIQRTKFKKTFNRFQQVLKTTSKILIHPKLSIVAAKETKNIYKMSHEKYDKLVNNSITQNNRKAETISPMLLPLNAETYQENLT